MQRNTQIDVLRGVGILLVVLGHNWIVLKDKEYAFRMIYAFHMPLFFYISGIFLSIDDGLISALKKRSSSLLKPYLSACAFATAVYWLTKNSVQPDVFWGVIYGNGNTLIWPWLWFIPCLFISVFFAQCCAILLKDKKTALCIVICCLLTLGYMLNISIDEWQLPTFEILRDKKEMAAGLPFNLDLAPIATAFVLLGYLTPRTHFNKPPSHVLTYVAAAILLGLHIEYMPLLDMNERILINPLATLLTTILSIYLTCELSKYISTKDKFSYFFSAIGKASLFIYLFHFPIQALFTFKLLKLVPEIPAISYVSGFAAGVLIPYLFFFFRHRLSFATRFFLPVQHINH